jgi:hypothetical protein
MLKGHEENLEVGDELLNLKEDSENDEGIFLFSFFDVFVFSP